MTAVPWYGDYVGALIRGFAVAADEVCDAIGLPPLSGLYNTTEGLDDAVPAVSDVAERVAAPETGLVDLCQVLTFAAARKAVFRHLSANDLAGVALMSRACWKAVHAESHARLRPTPLKKLSWWAFDPHTNLLAVRTSMGCVDVWHSDGHRVSIALVARSKHELSLLGDGRWLVRHAGGDIVDVYSTRTGASAFLFDYTSTHLVFINADVVFSRFIPSSESKSGFYDMREETGPRLLVAAEPKSWPILGSDRVMVMSRDRCSAILVAETSSSNFEIQLFSDAVAQPTILSLGGYTGYKCVGASIHMDNGFACVQVVMRSKITVPKHTTFIIGRYQLGSAYPGGFIVKGIAHSSPQNIRLIGMDDQLRVCGVGECVGVYRTGQNPLRFVLRGYVDIHVDLVRRQVVAADPVRRTFTLLPLDAYLATVSYIKAY